MTAEVQWSQWEQDPLRVAALADQHDVRIRRPAGAPLLLTSDGRASAAADGAVIAGRALRRLLEYVPAQTIADGLLDEFPWLDSLPQDDRHEFVAKFVRTFRACAELDHWSMLDRLIAEWLETAEVASR